MNLFGAATISEAQQLARLCFQLKRLEPWVEDRERNHRPKDGEMPIECFDFYIAVEPNSFQQQILYSSRKDPNALTIPTRDELHSLLPYEKILKDVLRLSSIQLYDIKLFGYPVAFVWGFSLPSGQYLRDAKVYCSADGDLIAADCDSDPCSPITKDELVKMINEGDSVIEKYPAISRALNEK